MLKNVSAEKRFFLTAELTYPSTCTNSSTIPRSSPQHVAKRRARRLLRWRHSLRRAIPSLCTWDCFSSLYTPLDAIVASIVTKFLDRLGRRSVLYRIMVRGVYLLGMRILNLARDFVAYGRCLGSRITSPMFMGQ